MFPFSLTCTPCSLASCDPVACLSLFCYLTRRESTKQTGWWVFCLFLSLFFLCVCVSPGLFPAPLLWGMGQKRPQSSICLRPVLRVQSKASPPCPLFQVSLLSFPVLLLFIQKTRSSFHIIFCLLTPRLNAASEWERREGRQG